MRSTHQGCFSVHPWVSDWVGLPYLKRGRSADGCDCLGLFVLLSEFRLQRHIPDPYCTIGSAIRGNVADANAQMYVQVHDPSEGDAILIRHKGFPIHVGYCIDHEWMLHTNPETGSVAERWTQSKWVNRVLGIYRYVEPV